MHGHKDMMRLPEGTIILGKSRGCPRQIVRFNERVYGLQCHLEFTEERTQFLIEKCPEDLQESIYIQAPETILTSDF